MSKRLWRVVPIYYAATLAMLGVALVAPKLLASTRIETYHVIASFLFVPVAHPVTFSALPLLPVGWTLNCEVQFYLFFAAMIRFAPKVRMPAVASMIIAAVLLGYLIQPQNPTFAAWTSPILIEFIFGMILGRLWHDLPSSRHSGLEIGLAAVMLVSGFAGLLWIPGAWTAGILLRDMRWLLAGIPAMLIVGGCLLLERQSRIPEISPLTLLGNASYSLYLCHFFVIGLLRAL